MIGLMGFGKSMMFVSLINYINESVDYYIIIIEDLIEFYYYYKKVIVN